MTADLMVRRVAHVMGMPVSLAVRGRSGEDADLADAWQRAVATLHAVDRVFSTYRPDSVISRLGRGEIGLAEAPPEVAEVLGLAERTRLESHGAFDVRRADAGGRPTLDTDGVVKGWAVERAARVLAALPDTDFCLSAGGDMVCRVADPTAAPWQVGVEDPADPSRLVARIPVRNGGVATSAFTHRGAHIVDARTGRPATGVRSVTVVAASLTDADLDATAAFALGRDALGWLRTRPGRTGLVVAADGTPTVFAGPGSCA
jgi:thiamine biosynthesis lipoprotein